MFYSFIFQRGREEEWEGDKYPCVLVSHAPYCKPRPQQRHVSYTGNHFPVQGGAKSTEPNRPGLLELTFKFLTKIIFLLQFIITNWGWAHENFWLITLFFTAFPLPHVRHFQALTIIQAPVCCHGLAAVNKLPASRKLTFSWMSILSNPSIYLC